MGLDIDLYTSNIDINDEGADDIIIEITGLKSISKFIGLEDTPLYYDNGKFFKVEDNKIVYADIQWKDISGDISESPEIVAVISDLVDEVASDILDERINLHNLNKEAHPYIQNTIQENYNTLDTKIDDTKEELSEALNTEITNRETADSELSESIQQETLARIETDTTLQNNIDTLTNNLNTEIENRTNADNLLRDDIDNVSGGLAQEILNRQTQDNLLQEQITSNYNSLDGKIDTEISNRTVADTTLQNNINAEALARQNADATLQGNIDTLSNTVSDNYTDLDGKISDLTDIVNDNDTAINNKVDGINTTLTNSINNLSNTVTSNYTTLDTKIDNTKNALDSDISDLSDMVTSNYNSLDARITTNTDNITTINGKIPNQASSSNQLADKEFVNSSIATNTATFRGTFDSIAELEAYAGEKDDNDYAFVTGTDSEGNTYYDRYKYNGTTWVFEYRLNNSSFTAQQWASINSGATSTNIGQISTNANDIVDLQTNKQDVLTAGANIQINNNIISATDTTYTAGSGISIENGVISNTQTSAEWGNIQGTLSNQTDLQSALDAKQNTISDLSTIRSGATLGATALQPNDNITELVNNAGYITSSALNGYATENFVTSQGYITGITSSDITNALDYTPYDASNPNGYISSASISSLTDVILTNVANNQALLYNNTTQKWENKDVTITVDSALDNTSTNPVENRVIAQAIEDITLAKNPNLNIIGGNLNIYNGNVSNFSTTDYMQFPFVFNFNGYTWTLEMSFTTGSDVTTQQNILDSYYGVAFAINNGKFLMALSSNGSSWDIGSTSGAYSVQANIAYSVKIAWDGSNYTLSYALDETNYTTDISIASTAIHNSTQEYVGGEPELFGSGSQHPFTGAINLNKWNLIVNGLEVWLGMDDVGLGSRANIDLSNLTEAGLAKFQAPLVSGTNIKTINNENILGSGNLTLDGLPSQTGQAGKFLTTNGTDASWATVNTATWGNITGTLSNQTDLQNVLNDKYDASNPDGYITSADLPTNYVTTNTAQTINAKKTFTGEKAILFKQNENTNKLGFTLYNPSNTELGAFEWRPNTVNSGALLNVNVPYTSSNYVGFRYWGTAVNVIAPKVATAGNYFIPTHITDGTNTVTASNNGTLDISSLLPNVTVDQTYDATSTNAQSGVAIEGELNNYVKSNVNNSYVHNNGNSASIGWEGKKNYLDVIRTILVNQNGVILDAGIGDSRGYTSTTMTVTDEGINISQGTLTGNDSIDITIVNSNLTIGSNGTNYQLLDGTTGLIPDARISSNIARTSQITTPTYDSTNERITW